MKKLLLVNQPVANRGDESAHRGFVRQLLAASQEVELTCLFVGEKFDDNIRQFRVDDPRVHYVNVKAGGHSRRLTKLGILTPLRFLWSLSPAIRRVLSYYREADYVVCAPGGADLGGFLIWKHLAYLCFARYCGKPLAYFGRSFGPLRDATFLQRLYRRKSLEILRYMRFISLRDYQSQRWAAECGLDYVPTVDSAYLELPEASLPAEVEAAIAGKPYVVFVPNVLTWHYNFAGRISRDVVCDFYVQLSRLILDRYPHCQMLMLPQTFNQGKDDDIHFFEELKSIVGNSRMQVLSDQYSSDLQQQIIRGAQLLVGARYHSVVFSINNSVPFVGLCYEHKISGMLSSLGKESCMVDLIHGLDDQSKVQATLRMIEARMEAAFSDEQARAEANRIAVDALRQFIATI